VAKGSAAGKVAIGLTVLLIALFALRSNERARVWRLPEFMMADAELHYPEGAAAQTRKAKRAALMGDIDAAVTALRAAHARGYNRLDHLLGEPAYARFQGDPGFRALLDELATEWLDRLEGNPSPSQLELRVVAQAHIVLEDLPAAIRAIERALELEGPITADLEGDLEALKRSQRIRERTRGRASGSRERDQVE
jgi:tetratricopeptide (TPR) repeat protein